MPNRIIREGWIDSERIDRLSPGAERFFLRLCLKADDYGRFSANVKLLRSALFPLRDDVRETDISRDLAAAQEAGLVRFYEVDRKRYLQIVDFKQQIRSKSKYPEPNGGHMLSSGAADAQQLQANDHLGVVGGEAEGEAEREPRASFAERPGRAEVQAHAATIGLAPWKADDWFDEMEGAGWLDHNRRPIVVWKSVLNRVRTKWEADGRPAGPPSKQNHSQASNSNSGTAEKILRSKELERVEARLREIRGGYDSHQTVSEADRKEIAKLAKRRAELKQQLGYSA